MADSTQFQIDIDVPSGGTSAAADAVARLATQLEAAGASATAAAEAVKAGEAAYSAAEKAAARTALAVEKIGLAADQQRGKLAAALEIGDVSGAERAAASLAKLTQRQAEAASKAEASKAALASEAASLDRLRSAADAASSTQKGLKEAHAEAEKAAKAQDAANAHLGKTNEIAEGLGKLGGPLGRIGQQAFGAAEGVKKLGASLGSAGPYVAIAVALVAIATAAVAGTAALTVWAYTLSDAASHQSLLYAGMVQSVSGGNALETALNKLATKVPQTSEKLRSMASELAKTGLRGKELEDALESAAVKAAQTELGPNWSKGMNSLEKQADLLKLHISNLFKLDTDRLGAALSSIIALFAEGSATGQAVRTVWTDVMSGLIDGLAQLGPYIVKAFIQFEIWALRALIAIKPYKSQIMYVVEALAVFAAVVAGVVVAAVVAFSAAMVWFVTVMSLALNGAIAFWETLYSGAKAAYDFAASIFSGAGSAIDWLKQTIMSAVDWLSSLSLADIGRSMIEGLISGITGAGSNILPALSSPLTAAIDGVHSLLEINSPSKVFARIGASTAEGLVQGVDSGAANVQGSLQSLVTPPADGGSPLSPAAAPSVSKSGHTFTGNIIIQGVKDGKDAMDRFLAYLEGDVDQLGAGEAQPA